MGKKESCGAMLDRFFMWWPECDGGPFRCSAVREISLGVCVREEEIYMSAYVT